MFIILNKVSAWTCIFIILIGFLHMSTKFHIHHFRKFKTTKRCLYSNSQVLPVSIGIKFFIKLNRVPLLACCYVTWSAVALVAIDHWNSLPDVCHSNVLHLVFVNVFSVSSDTFTMCIKHTKPDNVNDLTTDTEINMFPLGAAILKHPRTQPVSSILIGQN